MKMYGAYDSVYAEFLESFDTQKEAEEYAESLHSPYADGTKGVKIVKYLNGNDIMDTSYKVLKYC